MSTGKTIGRTGGAPPGLSASHYRSIGVRLVGASLGIGVLFLLANSVRASLQTAAASAALLEISAHRLFNSAQAESSVAEYVPDFSVTLKEAIAQITPKDPADKSPGCLMPPVTAEMGKRLSHSLRKQLSQWNRTLAARLEPVVWPQIHERSRLAKVPIVMYHNILPEKEVYFDITIEDLEDDFRQIQEQGLTPISLAQLVSHLRTGVPLPPKPVVLTFDDGYESHYKTVFKLLKRYRYPAAFSVFPGKLDGDIVGRSTLTWAQLKEMSAEALVTVVSHSVTHPSDLRELSDTDLRNELQTSKQQLEEKLGIPIRYFTYPEGNHDKQVVEATEAAGYEAALIMDNVSGQYAGTSENLLTLERFGESRFEEVIAAAWGGPPLPGTPPPALDIASPIQLNEIEVDEVPLTLISGGQLQTIHADSRYSVVEIAANENISAAVDGTFFSLEYLDSNTMIGPVLGQNTGKFFPGSSGDIDKLKGRPLVLLGPQTVQFVPFNPAQHNTLSGIQAELPAVTDAFVGAAWLVHQQKPQPASTFKNLFAYEESRYRAFWGINQQGQPVIGATQAQVDSVGLGQRLAQMGFQEAVMLDSGASTSLVYEGESLIGFESRTVPHVVALVPDACGEALAPKLKAFPN